MKKSLAILMDAIVISLLILLSSNYPETLPHYNPDTFTSLGIGTHGRIAIYNNQHNSGPEQLNPYSINSEQIVLGNFSTIPNGLVPSLSFHAPIYDAGNLEQVPGSSYTSIFSTTFIYLIVTETTGSVLTSN
jgi:hypothetical protein